MKHENAFSAVTDVFKENLLIFHPKEGRIYAISCDASDYVIELTLYQRNEDGEHRVIAQVKSAHRNYFTSEK